MIIIYTNNNLSKEIENKKIRDVGPYDFKFSIKPIQMSDAAIYIDYNENLIKIIKWRWKDNIEGIFALSDLEGIIEDAIKNTNKIGKSLRVPGTNKLRK